MSCPHLSVGLSDMAGDAPNEPPYYELPVRSDCGSTDRMSVVQGNLDEREVLEVVTAVQEP